MRKILMEKKYIIIIGIIVFICAIAIAVGIYSQITNKKLINVEEQGDLEKEYEALKINFTNIFDNDVHVSQMPEIMQGVEGKDIIYMSYDISEQQGGKYSISMKIPHINIDKEIANTINNEVKNAYGNKAMSIMQDATAYTVYNVNYVAYINKDVISLVILCKLKDGETAQRVIIKTYNYDIVNDRLLNIEDVVSEKGLDKQKIQKLINNEIEKINEEKQSIVSDGYNIYKRNTKDAMYKLENAEYFFVNKEGFLYIIYPYGNTNYTSEYDLIVTK